jgi:hypothetical protein
MYYRIAIQRDQQLPWRWQSTSLNSLSTLMQFLRPYAVLPQDQLRVFACSSKEGLEEQLVQENKGLGSDSVTAAQFLRERMIRPPETPRGASECEEEAYQQIESIVVATQPSINKGGGEGNAFDRGDVSSLERRRLELEWGAGGDHDLPYKFSLPTCLPQVLAWIKLLARVQEGTWQF